MLNHDNILQKYFASLNNHINDVSQFHSQTEKFLMSSKVSDLFYEDLGKHLSMQVMKETLAENKLSNFEKILTLIKEVASDSKFYLDKLSFFTPILGNLIAIVLKDTE